MSAIDDLNTDLRVGATALEANRDREAHHPQERNRTALERLYGDLTASQKMALSAFLPVSTIALVSMSAMWGLSAIAGTTQDPQTLAAIGEARMWTLVATAISVVAICIFGWVLRQEILGTTMSMAISLKAIAAGRTDIWVANTDRRDEYGSMARSIEALRIRTEELEQVREEAMGAANERDTLREYQRSSLVELADRFDRTVGEVVGGVATAASQLKSTATDMAGAADRSTGQSDQVVSAMEAASEGAAAAAAASDEFAMSIGEISRQAASSAELARNASTTAAEADETISALDHAAEQIGQVVELISTIAKRTNLLALNASIEAARGGEAGRGFAVVASEVKELASQTTRATEDVAAQIKSIQDSTGASVKALRTVSDQIGQLESTAISIASAVDQQSVAGQDLAKSIDRAARSTTGVRDHVTQVRETSLATGAAASQVLNSASELEQQADVLRAQVTEFLSHVRESV